MIKATYIICSLIADIFFIGGGAWLTWLGGNPWWVIGGVVLAVLNGAGFARRLNSWGDMGSSG